MKAIIKNYLEEQCAKDEHLAGLYKEECLVGCIHYITKLAKEKANNDMSIAIESTTVFKWARDYFTEGEALRDEERKRMEEAKQAELEAKIEAEQKMSKEDIDKRIKENQERLAKEEKERKEKEFLERQHAEGQVSIFDLGA